MGAEAQARKAITLHRRQEHENRKQLLRRQVQDQWSSRRQRLCIIERVPRHIRAVLFESVEAIDWKNVTVEQIRTDCPACPLPEGYAFTVKAIQYDMNTQSIKVIIKADKQYWGDVTPYQAQIESLTATVAEKNAQLTESEENLAAANAQLAELEATYDAN